MRARLRKELALAMSMGIVFSIRDGKAQTPGREPIKSGTAAIPVLPTKTPPKVIQAPATPLIVIQAPATKTPTPKPPITIQCPEKVQLVAWNQPAWTVGLKGWAERGSSGVIGWGDPPVADTPKLSVWCNYTTQTSPQVATRLYKKWPQNYECKKKSAGLFECKPN